VTQPDKRAEAAQRLESRLGYVFNDRGQLDRALTHASVAGTAFKGAHNEVMEFLGDRVLGLAAAEAVYDAHPDWDQGQLTRAHAYLVSGAACAAVAKALGVGEALRLANAASAQGGRANDRILGDAMEAIVAAVHLDGGFDKAKQVFNRCWRDRLAELPSESFVDPKTRLQEWAAEKGAPSPEYVRLGRVGPDHAPCFEIEVRIDGFGAARASGASVRTAEKAAATALLEQVAA
jgi:ribonuclease III